MHFQRWHVWFAGFTEVNSLLNNILLLYFEQHELSKICFCYCSNFEDGLVQSGELTSTESFCGIFSVMNPNIIFHNTNEKYDLTLYAHVRFTGFKLLKQYKKQWYHKLMR